MGRPAAQQHQRCRGCDALQEELERLQTQNQQQAKRDHQQCLLMFQQVQQLAKLNASLVHRRNGAGTSSSSGITGGTGLENILKAKLGIELATADSWSQTTSRLSPKMSADYTLHYHHDDPERQRLQALVVQQAHELETLRRKLKSTIPIPLGYQTEESKLIFNDPIGVLSCADQQSDEVDSECESGSKSQSYSSYNRDQKRKVRQAQLRRLPLTSLKAQIKGKDAEILRLQQLASKFEAQLVQIVDKKREMARNYQQITQVQQTQLKKYFAQLQRLGREKRDFESKMQEIGAYVAVLERKLVAQSDFYHEGNDDGISVIGDDSIVGKISGRQRLIPRQLPAKRNVADYILNVQAV